MDPILFKNINLREQILTEGKFSEFVSNGQNWTPAKDWTLLNLLNSAPAKKSFYHSFYIILILPIICLCKPQQTGGMA